MKTVKVLNEEIDALRFEAKGIYEAAKRADRELNEDEAKRFDEITDKKSGLIAVLKKQLSEAEDRERAIVEVSIREARERSLQEIDGEITGQSNAVLPINGVLPESRKPAPSSDRIFVRSAKLKAFKSETEAYDAGMWYRAIVSRLYNRGEDKEAALHCHRKGMDISNAAYEGSGSAGGYLVPPQISQTIIDVRERVGVARQVCAVQPMTSDMISIPKRAGGLTVYYPNELQTITDSDKSWQQVALAAQKRAVASKISQELVDDALISIVDNVVAEQAYALALQEDNELINGTGASSYGGVRGLLQSAGAASVYTNSGDDRDDWSEFTAADVMTFFSKLPDRFNRSPSIICSTNFYWAVFARLLAGGGGNTVNELQAGDGMRRTFWGIPVYTTSQMPTATGTSQKCCIFGQFDMAVILGDRTGIRVSRDDSTGFLADYTTLKATTRYDINVHEPGDANNPGAYIVLATNS